MFEIISHPFPLGMGPPEHGDDTRVRTGQAAGHELVTDGCGQSVGSQSTASEAGDESIGNFLVRETLIHEEFVEEQRDFGLPDDDDGWDDEDWGKGSWGWWSYGDEDAEGDAEDAELPADPTTTGDDPPQVIEENRNQAGDGLTPDEMRDILSSTKNSMDYDLIAAALQNLWDDQLLGNRPKHKPFYPHHAHYMDEADDHELYYQDGGAAWDDDSSWWDDGYAYYTDQSHEDEWWQDDWGTTDTSPLANAATSESVDEEKMREAQQAEQMAESLAIEAQRTWSEAQRATQALRRDRGFGAPGASNMTKCYICGGPHFMKDCPRNSGGSPKGKMKGKAKYGYVTDMDAYYIKGKSKSKGKSKGKKGMYLNADAVWKGKGKGPDWAPRTVNAYASDYFMGGLELSTTIASSKPPQAKAAPELGMIDCGATASAAPEAVVKGLISAILEKDSGARVDVDTNARPYFRFGDGRWGRALYRVHISSAVSGSTKRFALYVLPNPKEYFQAGFDKASLVPILIGMDFLGKDGNGLIIDFTTGLVTSSVDEKPEILQLKQNHKGHFLLDVREYLTRGHVNLEGHAHVVVSPSSASILQPEAHVLEFHVVQFDLTASDLVLESSVLQRFECDSNFLLNARDPAAAEILTAAMKVKAAPKKPRARSLDLNRSMKADPRDPRSSPKCWPCYGRHQPDKPQANQWGQWVHCQVCNLRILYTPRKGAPANHTVTHNAAMVKKMLTQLKPLLGDRKPTARVCLHMFAKITAEEVLEESIREIVTPTSLSMTSATASANGYHGSTIQDNEEELVIDYSHEVEVMAMASLMVAATASALVGLQLDGRDGLWEFTGTHPAWIVDAAQHQGLQPRAINLQAGYDLQREDTWAQLRKLWHQRRPRKLWFSLPCQSWCPWTTMDKQDPRQQRNLDTQRRKDRRQLGYAVEFVKYVLSQDDETQVYWEMPTNNYGWKQAALQHLREWLELKMLPWLGCRMDGCVYGLREESQGDLVIKKWTIQTNDERFHRNYRAKVCVGNHRHSMTAGVDYQRGSSYPKRMVESIVRSWRDELAPPRHHRLLSLQQDQPALAEEWMEAESVELDDEVVAYTDDNLIDHDSLLSESFRIQHEHQAREARTYARFDWETCSTLHQLHDYGRNSGRPHSRGTTSGVNSFGLGAYSHGAFRGISKLTFKNQAVYGYKVNHLRGALWSNGSYKGWARFPKMDRLSDKPSSLHHETGALDGVIKEAHDAGVSQKEYEAWQSKVSKFHRAAGHPTNRNLARIISDGGHPQWKIDVALQHRCPACEANRPGSTSAGSIPPASTSPMYKAWQAVTVDAAEWPVPGTRNKVKFLLFMDYATKLRVVVPIKTVEIMAMHAESAEDVIQAFSERWLSVFPKPQVMIMDSAKTFTSAKMHEFLSSLNILPHFIAEKEHWSHGVAEAAIQDVKTTATSIHLEAQDQRPYVTLQLTAAALNSTEYTAGFSAFQWAYGRNYNISEEDYRTFANEVDHQQRDFSQLVVARQQAEEIARKTKAQRVLSKLANTTVRQPLRAFKEMDLVKIWRKVWPQEVHKGPRGGMKLAGRPHWIGPGRVVFHEILPQQQPGDQRRHIVWVLLGARLYRCSVHSVRPVTETERFIYETSSVEDPSQWKSLADILPKREYQDIVDEEPNEEERELPDLPPQPDDSTVQVPTRRVRQKTSFRTGDYTSQPVCERLQTEEVNDYGTGTQQPTSSSTATSSGLHQPPSPETPDPKRAKVTEDDDLAETNKKYGSWVNELQTLAAMEEKELDLHVALEETHEFLKIEIDLGDSMSNRQRKMLMNNPQAFLVKKMRNSEVNIAKLPSHEKALFTRAKTKEVSSFISNEAVRKCLDDSEIREAYDSNRIVKARWVLTWKLVPPEEQAEAREDARKNPDTTHNQSGTKKAKARIVLLGFQHPSLLDRKFKTAAPVQSSIGRNLLYQMAAQHQWPIEGLDLATAFLHTQPTEADERLWTTGVEELREALGVGDEAIMRILRNIYGSTTAPRGLWLDLHKTLTRLGATPVLAERCMWIWKSAERRDDDHPMVIGAMGGHVDDFHRLGDGSEEWNGVKEQIDKAYKWGMTKKGNYRHAGTDVTSVQCSNGDFLIEVDQSYYAETVADIEISPERLREDGPLIQKEIGACRTSLGELQWLAIQTQPQLCARCNLLLTEVVTAGCLSHAREIQEMVCEVRRHTFKLRFFRIPAAKHWSDIVFVSMGDQAHNNRPRGDSTGGMITLMAGPDALQGKMSYMTLIAWRTWKLQRKSISSNDAEVQSILEAEDQNFRVRLLWTEMHGAGMRNNPRDPLVQNAERQVLRVRGVLCTDSRGGYDAVEVNESPLLGLSNMRAALQAFQLRDNLARVGCELRWLASDYDLADALTKKKLE
ncbi:unnamed protein product, partial [Symbiodinium sp. CCMP2456]